MFSSAFEARYLMKIKLGCQHGPTKRSFSGSLAGLVAADAISSSQTVKEKSTGNTKYVISKVAQQQPSFF